MTLPQSRAVEAAFLLRPLGGRIGAAERTTDLKDSVNGFATSTSNPLNFCRQLGLTPASTTQTSPAPAATLDRAAGVNDLPGDQLRPVDVHVEDLQRSGGAS